MDDIEVAVAAGAGMTDELERLRMKIEREVEQSGNIAAGWRGRLVDCIVTFEDAVRRDERASMRDSCGDTRLVIGTRLVCRNCGTAENRNIPIPCAARDGGTG